MVSILACPWAPHALLPQKDARQSNQARLKVGGMADALPDAPHRRASMRARLEPGASDGERPRAVREGNTLTR